MARPSDVLIVASHLPGEGHLRSERFWVAPVECRGDFDYWGALWRLWPQPHTIINVEHDMEVTDDHLQALLDCPHPLCSFAYTVHWITSGLQFDLIAAGSARTGLRSSLHGGEEWAEWAAIGLVKITAEARIGPLRREPWWRVELAVEDAVQGPWHLHGNGSFPGDDSGHIIHHHW